MKYKVGDRVKMRSLQWCKENIFNNKDKYPPELFRGIKKFCGKILTVSDAVDKSKYVDEGYYNMDEDTEWDYYWTDEMIEGLAKEECNYVQVDNIPDTTQAKISSACSHNGFYGYNDSEGNEISEWNLPDGYIFKDENGNVINATKIVLEKKPNTYPKTFMKCCEVLSLGEDSRLYTKGYKASLIQNFQKLLICRDAYWKIAGEEMGLGKPWKPDWNTSEPKYVIAYTSRGIEKQWETTYRKCFAFPTPEMRDAFYENFKGLIESCKELL